MKKQYELLFTPTKIGKCEIKNRFVMAPLGPLGLGDHDGGFNQRGINYYVERAKGGVGLIHTGVVLVDSVVEGHDMPSIPHATLNRNHFIRTSREMVERIHAYNSKIFLQLAGGFGRVGMPSNIGDAPPVAPSAIPHRWIDNVTCRPLKVEEIKHLVRMFAEGAANAKNAGFDGVQIHAVHEGYLLDQFAISFFNLRTDEYGGSLENRLRLAREIIEAIKKCCGDDYPVTLRYSLKSFIKDWRQGGLPDEKFVEKGRDIDEGIEAAKLLVQYGYDALDVDVGCYDAWWWNHPPMYQKKGLYMPYAKIVKDIVDVPVICAGRMDNPDLAIQALNEGVCDIISLGRPLLADPDYVNKLKADKVEFIRPCISCHEGCLGRIQHYSLLNCAVNPQCCREADMRLYPALKSKKVMIIGGGVAGCEAARVLKLRGHEPVVFEKTDKLGGNLIPGGMPDFKKDDHALADWFSTVLKSLNVEIHLNHTVKKEEVNGYDAVIVATGSTPKHFSLGDDAHTFDATDILMERKDAGKKTVIIGAGLVGCELALSLRQKNIDVTLIESMHKILETSGPLCTANHEMLERLVPYKGVTVKTSVSAKAYKNGELELTNGEKIKCDSVILAVGYHPNHQLYLDIKDNIDNVYLMGDAREVSNIMYAIWDAYEVASHLD